MFAVGNVIILTKSLWVSPNFYVELLKKDRYDIGTTFKVVDYNDRRNGIGLHIIIDGIPIPNDGGSGKCAWFDGSDMAYFKLQSKLHQYYKALKELK